MEKNIYIISMDYGVSTLPGGITYNELLEHLNKFGLKPEGNFEHYFQVWFYSSFYVSPQQYYIMNNPSSTHVRNKNSLKAFDDKKGVIMADAYSEYLDYKKLVQAKIDTKKNHRLAVLAILISGGLALIQIVLQLCSK